MGVRLREIALWIRGAGSVGGGGHYIICPCRRIEIPDHKAPPGKNATRHPGRLVVQVGRVPWAGVRLGGIAWWIRGAGSVGGGAHYIIYPYRSIEIPDHKALTWKERH